ncbi:MAG TPA: DNA repair protein RadA [Candidatus Nanoarchaeia archaeon]|nr:DNA repair protein RadA [Candidatus Nanoarchaeia archaeon]
MPKSAVQFVCQSCGATSSKWSGRCDGCGAWNSFVETAVAVARRGGGSTGVKLEPTKLASVDVSKTPRIKSGIDEFDQVIGGGIVPGSVMLLSGDPGIGKSTLVLQLSAAIAKNKQVLYVSGEESASQIKLRAERLKLADSGVDLLTETDADSIVATIEAGQYELVIIDSIQTLSTNNLTGAAGSVGQITACAQTLQHVAKQRHVAVMIIGHVTKEGSIAGPKILEHLVDVVLYLEGERYGAFKALRAVKNRFGSTNEAGIFEMAEQGLVPVDNPSAALLAERQPGAGSVVLPTLEGSRPVLIEVQALVSKSVFGYPKRTAAGFDLNRLNVLVAVLTKRAGLNLSDQDIYVNIVGGLKITEPAADLAIILSIASAFKNCSIKNDLVAYGEVGLNGEIRSVASTAKRLAEAKKLGFKRAVGPHRDADKTAALGVKTISQAIEAALESR